MKAISITDKFGRVCAGSIVGLSRRDIVVAESSGRAPVVREHQSTRPAGTGFNWVRPDAVARWEKLAFAILWLSALVAIGYCFKAVTGLSWPH